MSGATASRRSRLRNQFASGWNPIIGKLAPRVSRRTRDPQLGSHGPRVRLLTLGANLPIIGFHPEANWFRNRLRRLAVAPDIDWVDYQSRHDVMNFWPFDPVAGHDIVLDEDERRHPQVVAISFRDLWKPGNFARRRWRFFQAHFQFLLADAG